MIVNRKSNWTQTKLGRNKMDFEEVLWMFVVKQTVEE